jgi:hypothetical protein
MEGIELLHRNQIERISFVHPGSPHGNVTGIYYFSQNYPSNNIFFDTSEKEY